MEDHRATKAAPATTTITYSGQKNKINKKKLRVSCNLRLLLLSHGGVPLSIEI